jgi:hypothetical protein
MTVFRVVSVKDNTRKSFWAVERSEPDGLQIVVSRFYANQDEAEQEAKRLNDEAASRTMR